MVRKRLFKTKTFARWAKRILTDSALYQAAREIEEGNFEADLGDGICKKRVAIQGRGKSGSTRTLVAKKSVLAIIFLAGREKSDSGSDFSAIEESTAKLLAKGFERADTNKLNELAQAGSLIEICADGDGHESESDY